MQDPVIPWVVLNVGFVLIVAGAMLIARSFGVREPLYTTSVGWVLVGAGVVVMVVVTATNCITPALREMLLQFLQSHQHVTQTADVGVPQ